MKNFISCLIVCFAGFAAGGCSSSPSSVPAVPGGVSEALADTQALILESTYGGAPLKSAKDLDQYESRFPKAIAALKSGEVKMVWGKQIQDNASSPQVISYEAKAESGEGWAVKEDGKFHKVSASDLPPKK
ncbi:MAG: hypothetical protein NTY15_02105 [Planctomycetota bacterium]|nr:hypothetical protein [Planctomycetota bacterium]